MLLQQVLPSGGQLARTTILLAARLLLLLLLLLLILLLILILLLLLLYSSGLCAEREVEEVEEAKLGGKHIFFCILYYL